MTYLLNLPLGGDDTDRVSFLLLAHRAEEEAEAEAEGRTVPMRHFTFSFTRRALAAGGRRNGTGPSRNMLRQGGGGAWPVSVYAGVSVRAVASTYAEYVPLLTVISTEGGCQDDSSHHMKLAI